MDRRTYLATGAAIGTSALAGCSFTAAASTKPPAVPQSKLDEGGWSKTGEQTGQVLEQSYGPVTVTAVQHTLQYADTGLQTDIKERTLGQVDTALSVFFASHIDLSPNLDNLPVAQDRILSQVRANARSQFKQQMENQGLTDIEKTGEGTIDIDTGETATTDELTAAFPFQGLDFQVADGSTVKIPATDIEVSARMAVWHHGDFVIVAGGAHPAENFATTVDDELSEGVSVTVDIDLGLEPDSYHEEIGGLIAAVQ